MLWFCRIIVSLWYEFLFQTNGNFFRSNKRTGKTQGRRGQERKWRGKSAIKRQKNKIFDVLGRCVSWYWMLIVDSWVVLEFFIISWNFQDETQKKKKDKPKQVKEDRRTGLIDKRMYFKFWNLSFGWITCPIILVMVAGSQAVKILQEEEALTWFAYLIFWNLLWTFILWRPSVLIIL